ncbi:BofC C-terminal domain-containing protein [Bacillus songklensis]|uniref:BofC C-terminal domain-containing protein n=1 Tax=Bacillus songklensis TaxID=1069116 RepID=A0ABV8B1E4_9BACI
MHILIHQRKGLLCFITALLAWVCLAATNVKAAVSEEEFTVFLERVYLDGVVSQEVIRHVDSPKQEILDAYGQWRIIKEGEDELVFRAYIDDISPLLKTNGYFGISIGNMLSIYEGKPNHSTKVIQSFFQIDVERLESYHREELKKGIRVHSKDEYVSLMNFFKDYSLNSP